MSKPTKTQIRNCIVVSDLHCGCKMGLLPEGVVLDCGDEAKQNALQKVTWAWWQSFWNEWVPNVTKGEPYSVVFNGDTMDGRHHESVTQVSQNLADQQEIAEAVIKPIRDLPNVDGRIYIVRGTEAHVGTSAENEQKLAKLLQIKQNRVNGEYARNELWMQVGRGLVHFAHHVGTTGGMAYESSAIMKELVEAFNESARCRIQPPDVVARSHRHRHIEIRVPTERTYGISFCTAGWQGKTPFAYKVAGGRQSLPQFGGSLIRDDGEEVYTRHKTWFVKRSAPEVVYA